MSNQAAVLPQETFDEYTKQYIDSIFENSSGYISYYEGEKEEKKKEQVYLTYGEILYDSVEEIIKLSEFTKDDVFFDLGSGLGKVGLHVFMKSPVKQAIGIEYSEKRYDIAMEILKEAKEELPELFDGDRELKNINGNFLKVDISSATVIFICATCYSEELMVSIGEQINKPCKNVKHIFSLKQIPNLTIPLKENVEIECTWDKTKCFWYSTEG
jgi:hypothetical protein